MFLFVAFLPFTTIASVLALTDDPVIQKKIDNLKLYNNISDEDLIVDLRSFVRHHQEKPGLRLLPSFFDPQYNDVKRKTLDLMKQAIYATQERLGDLNPALEKYKDSPGMKMAFLFGRIKQLLIDMRRIYTLGLKKRPDTRVYTFIVMYTYVCKKYIDVIYIVEHIIDLHNVVMKMRHGDQD